EAGDVGARDQCLGWRTAVIHTGAAKVSTLDRRHVHSAVCEALGERGPRLTCADDNGVVPIHLALLSRLLGFRVCLDLPADSIRSVEAAVYSSLILGNEGVSTFAFPNPRTRRVLRNAASRPKARQSACALHHRIRVVRCGRVSAHCRFVAGCDSLRVMEPARHADPLGSEGTEESRSALPPVHPPACLCASQPAPRSALLS